MKLSDLLAEIEAKTTITAQWDDPNYLADLLLELGSYYATLGSHVADADRNANLAEAHYKYEREARKTDLVMDGATASLADSKARVATRDEEEGYIVLKHKAKLLSLARDSLGTNIDTIRSKLSYIKKDMEEPK